MTPRPQPAVVVPQAVRSALGWPLVITMAESKERWHRLARGLHEDRLGPGPPEEIVFTDLGLRVARRDARDRFVAASDAYGWLRERHDDGKELQFV